MYGSISKSGNYIPLATVRPGELFTVNLYEDCVFAITVMGEPGSLEQMRRGDHIGCVLLAHPVMAGKGKYLHAVTGLLIYFHHATSVQLLEVVTSPEFKLKD